MIDVSNSELQGRFFEAVKQGNVFSASNAAVQAISLSGAGAITTAISALSGMTWVEINT